MIQRIGTYLLIVVLFLGCNTDDSSRQSSKNELSIFFINDPHSQLGNFSKIKHIVDNAREETNVLLVAAGDIFSGSPFVDQYEPKGYPIIDVMNKTGFDIAVIGNHEFDYGLDILEERIEQSEFPWICANLDTESSVLSQPMPYQTLEAGDLKVTFLGLVETNGQEGAVIPSTHPWRVAEVSFQEHDEVVGEYENLKAAEEADVLVALTHLGLVDDRRLAVTAPFMDLIIGGHSNNLSTTTINDIPVLMAGGYLSHLGRVDLRLVDGEPIVTDIQLIDLDVYTSYDEELAQVIEDYENDPAMEEVVGNALSYHGRTELGCFYTEALATYMDVDVSFQNGGGIRSDLDAGDVTALEIYSIDPFNNGSVIFTKTVREIKDFFIESGQGLHVYGIEMSRVDNDIVMRDLEGNELSDDMELTIGINDYIPAVHQDYFDFSDADVQELTTAETLLEYLRTINSTIDHEGCDQYFGY